MVHDYKAEAARLKDEILNGDQSWRETLPERALWFLDARSAQARELNAECIAIGLPNDLEIIAGAERFEALAEKLRSGTSLADTFSSPPEDLEFAVRTFKPGIEQWQAIQAAKAERTRG